VRLDRDRPLIALNLGGRKEPADGVESLGFSVSHQRRRIAEEEAAILEASEGVHPPLRDRWVIGLGHVVLALAPALAEYLEGGEAKIWPISAPSFDPPPPTGVGTSVETADGRHPRLLSVRSISLGVVIVPGYRRRRPGGRGADGRPIGESEADGDAGPSGVVRPSASAHPSATATGGTHSDRASSSQEAESGIGRPPAEFPT
jgi:hypothetical protein